MDKSVKEMLLGRLPIAWRDRLATLKRYRLCGERGNGESGIVFFLCDGSTWHGGLCDRFKGMVSMYAVCKARGWRYRIDYTFPFGLGEYLVPNEYDWEVKSGEKSENYFDVRMMRLIGDATIDRLKEIGELRQLHVYANRDVVETVNEAYGCSYVWGDLFLELFKPSAMLQRKIECHSERIGGDYVAVAFRMQNIFGDFAEYDYKALDRDGQERVMSACMDSLERIYKNESKPLLVTSDSNAFLKKAKKLGFVYVIEGESSHPDNHYESGLSSEGFMKSFVDFYMLALADKVYAPATVEMYNSGFPETAAMVYGKPFERLCI